MALKTYKKLPIHIVEDHNEVLPFIYGAMGSRHLPVNNNCLLHLDSHPDLLVPKDLAAETASNKYELFSSLSIENWILPACYSAHFNNIFWIKPTWSNQIPVGKYRVNIGSMDNKIRVNSNLYYFLSDGLYVSKSSLQNRKEFNLNVMEMSNPDGMDDLNNCLRNRNYVLDIDLDFFSTCNPFAKMFKKGNLYDKLKTLYAFDLPEKLVVNSHVKEEVLHQNDLLKKVTQERNQQLHELNNIFDHLDSKGNFEEISKDVPPGKKNIIKDIIKCVKEYYEKGVDWQIVHNAGLTCDATELPHHVSTEEELHALFSKFEDFIQSLTTRPTLITMARSSEDDYCPIEQVNTIQSNVLKILARTFGEISVEKVYERSR